MIAPSWATRPCRVAVTQADIVAIIKYMIDFAEGEHNRDDIDHLENKRVRSVGELLQNQMRLGFLRMEKVARERMTAADADNVVPQVVLSVKPISASASRASSAAASLSQFMDQTNPLAELTHKRRLSALGPGGLSRQSAKLEVRDVHHSHYGRVCPIETPEGPNIGLIGSLAIAARVDEFGFILAPYRKVIHGQVYATDRLHDGRPGGPVQIAPANTPIEDGKIADAAICRYQRRLPDREAGRHRLHRRHADADRLAGDGADPVPGERRREPRPDGLQHAAAGGAAPAGAVRRSARRAWRGRSPRTPARRSSARREGRVRERHRGADRRPTRGTDPRGSRTTTSTGC